MCYYYYTVLIPGMCYVHIPKKKKSLKVNDSHVDKNKIIGNFRIKTSLIEETLNK